MLWHFDKDNTNTLTMRTFTLLWFGQLVSLLGTGITWFALTIWAWQETGQASALALVGFFTFLPVVLVSPFAGVFVDRWSRKAILIGSDLAAGLSTVTLFALYTSGNLALWHIYLIACIYQRRRVISAPGSLSIYHHDGTQGAAPPRERYEVCSEFRVTNRCAHLGRRSIGFPRASNHLYY